MRQRVEVLERTDEGDRFTRYCHRSAQAGASAAERWESSEREPLKGEGQKEG